VPRRIEIELTSARPDGTWTWRAAGAREPKGVLDGGLLQEGAKAGDVLRADAEFELEGIVITSVIAAKNEARPEAQRIEIVGPGRPEGPGVTTQLVGRGDRRERRRDDDDRRRDRGPGRSPDGRARTGDGRPRRDATSAGRPPRPEGDQETRGPRPAPERREGRPAAPRTGTPRDGDRRDNAGTRPARADGERRPSGSRPSPNGDGAGRTRGRRLNPGSAHRRAVMDDLPPEHQPIAEQLLRGGIPAVRTALHLEREKAESEGRAAPNTEALLALAESLLPRLRAAEWRDRAEAAAAAADEITMRDLRSVLAGADQARDDASRALAATLREAVDKRVAKLHTDWTADITAQLDAGRAVRAVRLASRPPDTGARLDAELTSRLVEAAGATMGPDTRPELWASMLEAVAESPIRRSVTPAGLPADAPPDLKRAAHQYSGSIPALAKLLGVTIPPPPAPATARKRPPVPGPAGRRPPRPDSSRPSGSTSVTAAPDAAAGETTDRPETAAAQNPPAQDPPAS
jgi:hypothetical protein